MQEVRRLLQTCSVALPRMKNAHAQKNFFFFFRDLRWAGSGLRPGPVFGLQELGAGSAGYPKPRIVDREVGKEANQT